MFLESRYAQGADVYYIVQLSCMEIEGRLADGEGIAKCSDCFSICTYTVCSCRHGNVQPAGASRGQKVPSS